jgi:hypothetical protein
VPVISPQARVPPPLMPLQLPPGRGGAGTAKGKRLTYYNELQAGLGILKSNLSLGSFDVLPYKQPKQKKGKASQKQRSAPRRNNNPFAAIDNAFRGF